MGIFYTPIMPIAPVIGFGGIIFGYWVDKYVLLKRHKMPETMGPTMAKFFANSIPYTLLIYAVKIFA
jgi:hypothetical protein